MASATNHAISSTAAHPVQCAIIVAATQKQGIGFHGDLPWKLRADLINFQCVTSDAPDADSINAVVMGSKTWMSIPSDKRPLKNRLNMVVSRTMKLGPIDGTEGQAIVVSSLDAALAFIDEINVNVLDEMATAADTEPGATVDAPVVPMQKRVAKVFCIGGSDMYDLALASPRFTKIHLTRVLKEFPCDRFFPTAAQAAFSLDTVGDVQVEDGVPFQFQEWKRNEPRHEEEQYLDLIRNILTNGVARGDRTGTGTISVFAPPPMVYNLRNNVLPLGTTKSVPLRLIFEELQWFCSGSTDTNVLSERNVKIWDANASRKALDELKLTERRVGDAGPIYGHQLRHAGASYTTCDADYSGQGFDQLADLLKLLSSEKGRTSRRLLLNFWDPSQMHKQVLPACHVLAQFYVCNGELSCQMYQRSADVILGVPFNTCSYALLVALLAKTVGLTPGTFTHVLGDAHIYNDHIEAARLQSTRKPYPFPTVNVKRVCPNIEDYKWEDIELTNYLHHPSLGKLKMSV